MNEMEALHIEDANYFIILITLVILSRILSIKYFASKQSGFQAVDVGFPFFLPFLHFVQVYTFFNFSQRESLSSQLISSIYQRE